MLAQERYNLILSVIEKNGSAKVTELAKLMNISAETIRRDLIVLESRGRLNRVFGGAVSVGQIMHFESLEKRKDMHTPEKEALSKNAIQLIEDGDILAIDAGSTATVFAGILKDSFKNLTIVTYSYDVFDILKDSYNVILTGGDFCREENYFGGTFTEEFLRQMHVNKAILFVSGISIEHGAEDFFSSGILSLQRILLDISDKVFILADSSKIGARAMIKLCDLSSEHIYVSDSGVSQEMRKKFADNGYTLICDKL